MDHKELRGLVEAYSEIYAPQEEIEEVEQISEAEGSYGQTPKARAAMGKVAISRREKPASEYSQKGEKTRKVKEIEKHTRRIDSGPNVGNRGKRSTPPRWTGGRGKMDQDARDYGRADSAEYGSGTHGSGTVTKNPKKLRKQKAMGEIGESYDIFDVVLEFLQVEGFAETLEDAEFIMANDLNAEVIDAILEARKSYSATAAKAGKDIGKKGKIFGRIAREAGERYGSAERGKKVAGAILAKLRAKHG